MRRRFVLLFRSLCFLFPAAAAVLNVHAGACPKLVLINSGVSTANERAPNASFLYGRAVYLIPETELATNGLVNGVSPPGIGWSYATNLGVAATGSLKVYLENTTDTVNAKSLTWTTAIAGMTLVHNATTTLPDVVGPWSIVFSGGSSFTYGGHGLYVAFDWQNPGGGGGSATVSCSNLLVGGANGLKGSQSNTAPPTTIASSSFRPETQLSVPAPDHDASIAEVMTLGVLPVSLLGPETVVAAVSNAGSTALTNLAVTVDVAGADSFTDTRTIPSLAACGGKTLVSFAPYTPLAFGPATLGDNTVTVSLPVDDVAANNTKSKPQRVTVNQVSYKYPGSTATGGAGINGGAGELAVRFSTIGTTQIDAVTVEFPAPASGATYRLAVRENDGGGFPGALLYVDAADRTAGSAGTFTLRLPTPVVVGPGSFFVGVRQTSATSLGFGYDLEQPMRPATFYTDSPLDSGTWADFSAAGIAFKLNLGITLGACLVPLAIDVTPNGTSHACSGDGISLTAGTAGGTGALTYQWTENGIDIPLATGNSYVATKSGPGSFAYNARVTDDGGCVDAVDALSPTGTWAAPPTASVGGGGLICGAGSSTIRADLTGTGPWSLSWSDGFNQAGVTASPATRAVSPGSTTVYTVTSVADTACPGSSAGNASVMVNPVPAPRPTRYAAGSRRSSQVC